MPLQVERKGRRIVTSTGSTRIPAEGCEAMIFSNLPRFRAFLQGVTPAPNCWSRMQECCQSCLLIGFVLEQ
jgi:hypothetical protein